MILFNDNRKPIHYLERLNVAIISNTPIGENYVQLTEDWYENPIVPYQGFKITDIITPCFMKFLSFYIKSLAEDRDMDTETLYLSILKSQVDLMDKKYAEIKK